MAFRAGITGLPNSGKSWAWKTYVGDSLFAICPSAKILHSRTSEGKVISSYPLTINGKTVLEIARQNKLANIHDVVKGIVDKDVSPDKVEAKGHYVVCSDINYVFYYKMFVDRYMPKITEILNPDFTHYVSYIIQTPEFQRRKSGGEAFARFWELAADTLRNVILSSDQLRGDILDFTEFHSQWNDEIGQFEIYTPAGNMLVDKFKPETYFDLMLYSYVLPYEVEQDETKRFKFMTIKKEGYDGRSMGLFSNESEAGLIPNDMNLVMSKLREYLG